MKGIIWGVLITCVEGEACGLYPTPAQAVHCTCGWASSQHGSPSAVTSLTDGSRQQKAESASAFKTQSLCSAIFITDWPRYKHIR
jgi:hypothetical protein